MGDTTSTNEPRRQQPADADWQAGLKRDGYALFPGLCPAPLVAAARGAIERDLTENYDPRRQIEYDHRSYCPDLRTAPPLMALLLDSGITARLDELIGFDRLAYSHAQIALRQAGASPGPATYNPHIDGLPTPHNGVPADVLVSNFTALVGVFLSPAHTEFAGNFTVWPGSHDVLERHFRAQGLEGLRQGMPDIPLGEPLQLLTGPGDVVLCHYQLAHSWVANRSPTARCAIYFRLWFKDIDAYRWALLTDIWRGWRF